MMPDMELALPARAENIALIRHAFGALGEALAVNEELLSDVRLAVTEACSNVVVHAYPEDTPGAAGSPRHSAATASSPWSCATKAPASPHIPTAPVSASACR